MSEPPQTVMSGGQVLPGVHVARFSASAIGPVVTVTFFGLAGVHADASPLVVPAFTGVFLPDAVLELRDVLNNVLTALQTLGADEQNPQ